MQNNKICICTCDSILEFDLVKSRVFKKFFYKFNKDDNLFESWHQINYISHNNNISQELKKNTLKSYEIAKIFNLKIHKINNMYILTSTPLYTCSLDKLLKYNKNKSTIIEIIDELIIKIKGLVKFLISKEIIHDDFNLSNICIDKNQHLHLIDFEHLSVGYMNDSKYIDENNFNILFIFIDNDIRKYSNGTYKQIKWY